MSRFVLGTIVLLAAWGCSQPAAKPVTGDDTATGVVNTSSPEVNVQAVNADTTTIVFKVPGMT